MGFIIHEFVTVPEPLSEFRHQSNSMTVVKYLVDERKSVEAGSPIIELENYWARFHVVTQVRGQVAKNLFDWAPGITLKVGTPVVLMVFEPEDLPSNGNHFETEVAEIRRKRQ